MAHLNANSSTVPNELETIDRLAEEFFSSFTSNERKREIEESLQNWLRTLPNCWEKTFYLFQLSNSLYTKIICLSLLQDFLNKNWYLVPSNSRTLFYEGLFKYLLHDNATLNHGLRNKLCQIVVFLVGQDWHEHSASFLTNILQLLNFKSRSTYEHSISLAVNLIKLIVEELPANFSKYQLFQMTREEFIDKIQQILPGILEKLSFTIESVLKIQIDVINSTPPPSPTGSNGSNMNSMNVTKIPNLERLFGSISEMDCDVIELLTSISQCVESIIEFMTPAHIQHLSKTLLSSLGFFATAALLKPNDHLLTLAHSSMNCINQLLEKKVNFDSKIEFMINEICQYFFVFLRTNIKIVFERTDDFADVGCELAKKFIEFLKHSMKFHFERYKPNSAFSPESFLSLLLQITEKMFRLDSNCFLDCLEIWDSYFGCYHAKIYEHSRNQSVLDQTIFLLTEFLLNCLQYSLHRDILTRIDDKESDSEGMTQMDRFLTQTNDMVLQVCSLYPIQGTLYVFDTFFSNKLNQLRAAIAHYESNMTNISSNLNKIDRFFVNESLCQLQIAIMDFGMALRVCSVLFADYNQTFNDSGQVIGRIEMAFQLICDILKFIEERRYTIHQPGATHNTNPLYPEFLLLKTEILSTLHAYQTIFHGIFDSTFSPELLYDHCCRIVCDIQLVNSLPDEYRSAQSKLFHCAATFLCSLTAIDRWQAIYSQPCFERFCSQDYFDKFLLSFDITKLDTCSIPIRDKILILKALINCLVLPFEKILPENQLWEHRQTVLSAFICKYFQLFNNLNQQIVESTSVVRRPSHASSSIVDAELEQKCPNMFCESLFVMKSVIEDHNGSNSKSKQIFFDSLKEPLESFISLLANREFLYSTLSGTQIVAHIFGLFYSVFNVLFKQLPEGFFLSIVNSCIQIINAFQILSPTVDLAKETPQKVIAALEVALQFVKLLTLAVRMTKFKYRDLLINILEFLTQQVYTSLIKEKSAVTSFLFQQSGKIFEIYSRFCKVFYEAFKETLFWNSSYFFPVNGTKIKDDNHELYFQRIMEIFGQSFSHPENLQTFKQNIGILNFLNSTVSIKIFSRQSFQNQFLEPFLLLFLRVTQDQSLKLLEEDLFSLIYQLASVDFGRFQCSILPTFIAGYSLSPDDCKVLEANFCKFRNGISASNPAAGAPVNNTVMNHSSDCHNPIDSFAFSKLLFQLFTDIRFYQHQKSVNKFLILT